MKILAATPATPWIGAHSTGCLGECQLARGALQNERYEHDAGLAQIAPVAGVAQINSGKRPTRCRGDEAPLGLRRTSREERTKAGGDP